MEIKRVIICGLGAVGLTYANKLKDICDFKCLIDTKRAEKYKINPPIFNKEQIKLDYILPTDKYNADLIIIATKNDGLDSAIEYIKNFVGDNTIIISLLNGITSEEKIAKIYGWDKVLHSYFIGHSAMREGNCVTQDGVGKIFFGSPYKFNQDKVGSLKNFFEKNNIDCEIPNDIIYSLWLKYTFNTYANQISAAENLTFGEMRGEKFEETARGVIKEVVQIARKEGVNHFERLEEEALGCLAQMIPEGKTSMLQDLIAGRKTEVDIFSGEIIKRGEKYGITTPYNRKLYAVIRDLENRIT